MQQKLIQTLHWDLHLRYLGRVRFGETRLRGRGSEHTSGSWLQGRVGLLAEELLVNQHHQVLLRLGMRLRRYRLLLGHSFGKELWLLDHFLWLHQVCCRMLLL